MVMIISKRGTATSKTEDNYDGNDFQKGHVYLKGPSHNYNQRRMVMKKM